MPCQSQRVGMYLGGELGQPRADLEVGEDLLELVPEQAKDLPARIRSKVGNKDSNMATGAVFKGCHRHHQPKHCVLIHCSVS